ncbi:MAG: S41 family peptidase [Chloroflexi bacterium]|nr:S41 family peptidase [Chloroflexota bacterium]
MSRFHKVLLITLVAVLVVGASFYSGVYVSQRGLAATAYPSFVSIPREVPPSLGSVWEVWGLLSNEYVETDKIDAKKMRQGAIKGMLDVLKDPYTSYLDADNARIEFSDLQGKFDGIGAQVGIKDGQLIVIAPIPDTPASRAGIRAGDAILEVEGVSTEGLSVQEVVIKIRGPKGAPVNLLMRHEGEKTPFAVTIVRDEISVRSVRWQPKGNIAVIQISHFAGDTGREVRRALGEARAQGMKGIVLDMRFNPGGLLNEVVDVASQFIDEGKTVLFVVSNRGDRQELKARAGGIATDIPVAVLVDNHSASGSEVLSGALQDHKRAVIFGAKTFGKGSVNMLFPLRDGSGLYLTTARWHTPTDRAIEGKGVTPDVEIVSKPEELAQQMDPALDRALEYVGGLIGGKQTAGK